MPIAGHELRGQAADAEQLLAMLEVRRRVQSGVVVGCVAARLAMKMAAPPSLASLKATVAQLDDLITALDRRLPQVERSGESAIANAAVRLRNEAVKRIGELEAEIAGRPSHDRRPTAS